MTKERELLSWMIDAYDSSNGNEFLYALEEIRAYLAADPEAETIETLRAENFKLASGQCTEGGPWGDEGGTPYCKYTRPDTEDEPVGWIQPNHLDKAQFMPFLCRVEPKQKDDFIPLYTRPKTARKPMTEEEIKTGHKDSNCYVLSCIDPLCNFSSGVRYAEKHHWIGGNE